MSMGDGVRRNVAQISHEEMHRLRDAFIELNRRFYPGNRDEIPAGGVSHWFKQDEIHQSTHVHGGPAFLPWHRELCNRLEVLLRDVDPVLSLHYWDWTTDPQNSPDGTGGFVNLFSPDFMGAASGTEAGEPWLSAGFYNPNASPDRDTSSNPADPPRNLIRAVGAGIPELEVADSTVIAAETYPEMRDFNTGLERAHNLAHSYIGGTIGFTHTSFRDPFVFLMHSNVDRLFALWQRQPGKKWRLDPELVYGTESNTDTVINPFLGRPIPGILTPMEPWAGNPNNSPGIVRTRPWATPENEHLMPENRKNSKHPSVVMPPRYDTDP
jgi:hypothetical protein